jgi:hypothetical protein
VMHRFSAYALATLALFVYCGRLAWLTLG